MTPKQFDGYLQQKRAELTEAFKDVAPSDGEVLTKVILDFQEVIARDLLREIDSVKQFMTKCTGDILKDHRLEREAILKEIRDLKSK